MEELDWSALEINHCPKDGKELPNASDGMVSCECGFKIRESRYEELLDSLKGEAEWGGEDSFDDNYDWSTK